MVTAVWVVGGVVLIAERSKAEQGLLLFTVLSFISSPLINFDILSGVDTVTDCNT